MINKFIEIVNPISFLIWVTFCFGCLFLNKHKQTSQLVLLILLISSIIELLSVLLLIYRNSLNNLYSIGIILNNSFWLLLAVFVLKKSKKEIYLLYLYLLFCILNYCFFENQCLNYMSFIVGALTYLIYITIKFFEKLQFEQLDFFKSTDFIILASPIMFFLGFSFIMGFRNSSIRNMLILKDIDLYSLIGNTVNIIYYILINIYIYKERKLKNG